MTNYLGKAFSDARDGENNPIDFDAAYPVYRQLPPAVEQLRRDHGDNLLLLPMSGTSCGGGIFQARPDPGAAVIGLRFDPPPQPRVSLASEPELAAVELDEIRIDSANHCIAAGAAVTLEQLNQALAQQLGAGYRVPGADLTSYQYAAAGATFMTGGMGPQRRYFSDSVIEIAIYDGEKLLGIEGDALAGYAGTYGWSGIVTALRCRYYRFAGNEIAFALPVKHDSRQIGHLLEHLAPHTYLQLEAGEARSSLGAADLILGLEHVSLGSMQPLLHSAADARILSRAKDLQRKCLDADADGLIFVNAVCENFVDDFVIGLVDDADAAEPTLAGISLEHAEMFGDAEEMRNLREAIPYAARMQQPRANFLYKNHSDANIRVSRERVAVTVADLWQINLDYVARVESHFDAHDDIDASILIYGHLNPYGFDPHNRVTLGAERESAFLRSREFLLEARAEYYRALADLCARGDAEFIGGEKTADSEIAIYRALGGTENAPAALRQHFEQQRATVRAASPIFNWRALSPYV